jgi:hypothetical protein
VNQWARKPAYSNFSPLKKGRSFHTALAAFLGREELHADDRMFYPFMAAIRSSLRDHGYEKFNTEERVGNQAVHGRADIIAEGLYGSAVVEVKVAGTIPLTPPPRHILQTALSGFLMNKAGGKQMLVFYVDLADAKIRMFSWADHRHACLKPWELKAA